MVSLTKKQTVDPLHGRFRPLNQSATETSPEKSPHPPSPLRHVETPDPTQGREVIRYVPPTPRETRSQQDRLARADAGDLQARLDLISLESAEAALAQRCCKHEPDRSILSYLQDPGDGLARYQAASSVLEQLADQTEETAFDSVLVFRYIKAHELWKDHPSPDIRSAEDLVRQLDGSDYVQANIVIGTSAQAAKRNCVKVIDSSWGSGWFEKIPLAIKDPTWTRAEECSKRTLVQMAANAKQGISLEDAVESWTQAIHKRNDPVARRENNIRSKTTAYIMPNDVASLNRSAKDTDKAKRTSEMFFPDEVKEDRLRVELVPPPPTSYLSPRPDYSAAAKTRKVQKRKRLSEKDVVRDESDEDDGEQDGWTKVGDRSMVKRVRGHLIRRSIDDNHSPGNASIHRNASSQLLNEASFGEQSVTLSSQPPSAQPITPHPQQSKDVKLLPTCDGQQVALMFRKFVDLLDEMPSLDMDPEASSKCCDVCRPMVVDRSARLRHKLACWANQLAAVEKHTIQETKTLSSQVDDISPCKARDGTSELPLFVGDSDSSSE